MTSSAPLGNTCTSIIHINSFHTTKFYCMAESINFKTSSLKFRLIKPNSLYFGLKSGSTRQQLILINIQYVHISFISKNILYFMILLDLLYYLLFVDNRLPAFLLAYLLTTDCVIVFK